MIFDSKNVQFQSLDGVQLHGTVVSPKKGITSVALFVHGITSDRSEWGVFDRAAEVFAEQSIASLRFDYRGHGESDFPSREITLAGIGGDIAAAWIELQKNVSGENSKAFIIGSSFGGGVAYHTAAMNKNFTRAMLLAPVFDYAQDIKKTAEDWESDLKEKGYIQYSSLELSGDIVREAESFRPISNAAKLRTTIWHGTKDDDVPIANSRAIAERYDWVELVEVVGAGHVIAAPGDLDMENELSWKFVEKTLSEMIARMSFDD
jgi:hypothetical protein